MCIRDRACLWAVAGSLSSRQEDLSTTTQPMQLLLLVAFMGGTFAQGLSLIHI